MTSDFSRHAGGPQGPAGKRKGGWWRHWTWKKTLVVAGGTLVFFVLVLFGTYEYLVSSATIISAALPLPATPPTCSR